MRRHSPNAGVTMKIVDKAFKKKEEIVECPQKLTKHAFSLNTDKSCVFNFNQLRSEEF